MNDIVNTPSRNTRSQKKAMESSDSPSIAKIGGGISKTPKTAKTVITPKTTTTPKVGKTPRTPMTGKTRVASKTVSFVRSIEVNDGMSIFEWVDDFSKRRKKNFVEEREKKGYNLAEEKNLLERSDPDLYASPGGILTFRPRLPFEDYDNMKLKFEIEDETKYVADLETHRNKIKAAMKTLNDVRHNNRYIVNLEDRRRLKSDDSLVRTEKEIERLQKEFDEIDKIIDEQRMRIERATALMKRDEKELEDQANEDRQVEEISQLDLE